MNLGKLWQMAVANTRLHAPVDEGGDGGSKSGDNDSNDNSNGEGSGDNSDEGESSEEDQKLLREVMKKKEKINSLTEANTAMQQQLEELQSRVKQFDGIDLDEVKTLKEQQRLQREQELESQGNWEELKKELADRHQAEKQQIIEQRDQELQTKLGESNQTLEQLQAQLQKRDSVIEELTVGNAFGSSRYVLDELVPSPAKVRKLYGEHFDVVDGEIEAFDKPRGADQRNRLVDGNGDPLGFELALAKIVESDPDVDTIKRAVQTSGDDSYSDNRNGDGDEIIGKGSDRILSALNKS